ncbi:MAG TPA: iron ABC transporter permease [Stellaceae bacterium]|nr:iron ABC transporter permease [Stellaceae bacterium]
MARPRALALGLLGWSGLAAVALVCVMPVVVITLGSFSDGNPFNDFQPSLEPWRRALDSSQTLVSIGYSFLLSLRVPVALVVAFFVAWYLARNDVFGKRSIMYALWLAFFLPILPATLGWILLLDPHYGLVNVYAESLLGLHGPLLDIYSLAGISWVHLTLTTIPIMVILIEPAQRFIDSSYEEAATMSGAGTLTTLRRVTLPLIVPTLLTAFVAGLIRSLEAFEVEQVLGVPAGILVYSTRIFNLLRFTPPDEPQAMALSTFFLVILFALVVCYRFLLRWGSMVATMTGKGGRFLARARTRFSYLISALLFAALIATVVLPFAMVTLSSFSRLFGFFNLAHPWTMAHWSSVLESPSFAGAMRQSLYIGAVVASLGTMLYLGLAWFIARNDFWGKSALSLAIWLPWAIPGVLLGTAFITIFLNVPALRLAYGTALALVVVLMVQGLPFATHIFEASISQVSRELEESALISGATPLGTVRRITVPLIAPMIANVFVISFMAAMKDISATVLVATPGTQTLPLLMFGYATSGKLEDASVVGVITVAIAMVMALLVTRVGDRAAVMR